MSRYNEGQIQKKSTLNKYKKLNKKIIKNTKKFGTKNKSKRIYLIKANKKFVHSQSKLGTENKLK